MSKGFSPVTKGKTLKSYLKKLPTLGFMTANGNCLILVGFYPKIESASSLSDILEANPDLKYFLSRKTISRLLKKKRAKWLLQS